MVSLLRQVVFALSDCLQIYMVSNKVLDLAAASLDQIVTDLKVCKLFVL